MTLISFRFVMRTEFFMRFLIFLGPPAAAPDRRLDAPERRAA
jgi:hypothetical protein